jgi:hypothetical protein
MNDGETFPIVPHDAPVESDDELTCIVCGFANEARYFWNKRGGDCTEMLMYPSGGHWECPKCEKESDTVAPFQIDDGSECDHQWIGGIYEYFPEVPEGFQTNLTKTPIAWCPDCDEVRTPNDEKLLGEL